MHYVSRYTNTKSTCARVLQIMVALHAAMLSKQPRAHATSAPFACITLLPTLNGARGHPTEVRTEYPRIDLSSWLMEIDFLLFLIQTKIDVIL